MRIIAGDRGRARLKAPKGSRTRPTLSRVRESLFMRLSDRLPGARVLDLFAGAGALGLEALSRGAASAVLVELSRGALRALNANVEELRLVDRAVVVPDDAIKFLKRGPRVPGADGPFDLILADPPYGRDFGAQVLSAIDRDSEKWLAPDSLIVMQVGRRDALDERVGSLSRVDSRSYGETRIDFYRVLDKIETF